MPWCTCKFRRLREILTRRSVLSIRPVSACRSGGDVLSTQQTASRFAVECWYAWASLMKIVVLVCLSQRWAQQRQQTNRRRLQAFPNCRHRHHWNPSPRRPFLYKISCVKNKKARCVPPHVCCSSCSRDQGGAMLVLQGGNHHGAWAINRQLGADSLEHNDENFHASNVRAHIQQNAFWEFCHRFELFDTVQSILFEILTH